MSLSSFHRVFRQRTGQNRLKYARCLHAARDMILFDFIRIGDAARRVGDENMPPFSRDYRRDLGEAASSTRDASGAGEGDINPALAPGVFDHDATGCR